ncbi:hypothetical protein V1511DRAFT_490787 [Dipodascopsis uninucleata]
MRHYAAGTSDSSGLGRGNGDGVHSNRKYNYQNNSVTASSRGGTAYDTDVAIGMVAGSHQAPYFGRSGRDKTNQTSYVPNGAGYDASYEAAIATQQSIYVPQNLESASRDNGGSGISGGSSANTLSSLPSVTASTIGPDGKRLTVIREGGGRKWEDPTLLEWDPSHFRLFVGNLGGDVSDDSLLKAFGRYPSISKARVIKDKKTDKNKGYGFVAFKDPEDYLKAFKEMNGKYIGSHPVLLRKAQTEIKSKSVKGAKPYDRPTSNILKEAQYKKRK